MDVYRLLRPALFALPAETAHEVTLRALRLPGAARLATPQRVESDGVERCGLRFPNRVGLAAGLDKNGDYLDALGRLGFGFVELGTVTPRPQPGNPRPRMFRLPRARAIINRLGFNNKGVKHLVARVKNARYEGVLGINIGKNWDTPNERALDDYLYCLRHALPVADYLVVNVSSPNTRDLRALQDQAPLEGLLAALCQARDDLAEEHGHTPLLVKIAPDFDAAGREGVLTALANVGVDGVVVSNTTVARDAVAHLPHGSETGGLSGEPLFQRATDMLSAVRARLPEQLIIGVGGIMDRDSARAKFDAGADLVQLYTGLIYRGPSLIADAQKACP